jgi:hypothetical protein
LIYQHEHWLKRTSAFCTETEVIHRKYNAHVRGHSRAKDYKPGVPLETAYGLPHGVSEEPPEQALESAINFTSVPADRPRQAG